METKVVHTILKIYFNPLMGLEFLTVGDYGKENNIKADFLGLTKKIDGVQHHDVNIQDKWVATISTQKGCPMKCTFCDVHKYGFFGNAQCLIWNTKSAISLSMRMYGLPTVSMFTTPVWVNLHGIPRFWSSLSIGLTPWSENAVCTPSQSTLSYLP